MAYVRKNATFLWQRIPCYRCGNHHRWNKCPKRIPRGLLHHKPTEKCRELAVLGADIYKREPTEPATVDALAQAIATVREDNLNERLEMATAQRAAKHAAHDAIKKYKQCVAGAKTRGIPFLLTFEEWWQIWQDSGHWEERGNLSGQYVMCRNADQGPYAVGNVRIDTVRGNWLEQLELAKAKHEAYENDT
jgi:hypothetical protein